MGDVLEQRRDQSQAGLDEVRAELDARVSGIIEDEPLAIYVTGSFGRMEARYPRGSDLDLFLLYAPRNRDPDAGIDRLRWYRLAAEIIAITEDLSFKPFSRDGEYLKIHNVWRVGEQLGSRHDSLSALLGRDISPHVGAVMFTGSACCGRPRRGR